ncbi:hypothetical protein Y032_0222g2606 [Ancylostoma ceylanicum]|uniref:Uncharacterized protein n=1 Tax=Ancylostoma ceylanicum TaxID=53326 RepID=A0A016SII0_9BILA|nr:hypothetical protein Y032_0222g2606 [Ancylostoma ceylanicum]
MVQCGVVWYGVMRGGVVWCDAITPTCIDIFSNKYLSSPLQRCSFRIDVGEIAFAKYPLEFLKRKGAEDLCITFQDGRGSVQKCSGYFLLVNDRYM